MVSERLLTGARAGRRSFSDGFCRAVTSVRPGSSHPSNLRASKQQFYGLLQLNDRGATAGARARKEGHVTTSPSNRRRRSTYARARAHAHWRISRCVF